MLNIVNGCPLELPLNDNYIIVKWEKEGKEVYFSAAQQGEAMAIHLAAERKNRVKLREALKEFINWVFDNYCWCRMIIGAIKSRSVSNLAANCGFDIFEYPSGYLAVRVRK